MERKTGEGFTLIELTIVIVILFTVVAGTWAILAISRNNAVANVTAVEKEMQNRYHVDEVVQPAWRSYSPNTTIPGWTVTRGGQQYACTLQFGDTPNDIESVACNPRLVN